MKKSISPILLSLITLFVGSANAQTLTVDEINSAFAEKGFDGIFIAVIGEDTLTNAPGRLDQQYPPASTYKIFNSLIGLETGVLADSGTVFQWDGVERPYESWNRDASLASAIRYSVVWYYQELARRAGREASQHWLDTAEYGNQTIGEAVDLYWLDGSLKISPRQQIEMLTRLRNSTLPFSERSMQIVRDITMRERGDGWELHGKTGTAVRVSPRVGWFVGWVEREEKDPVFFATLLLEGDSITGFRAQGITWELLQRMEVID